MNSATRTGLALGVISGLFLATGCTGMMQSMMTTSVDESASSKVLSSQGQLAGKRMKTDGNAEDLNVVAGLDLKTADMVMGSDDENSVLDLSMDEKNWTRFTMTDLVLRSPLGKDSKSFVVVMELGNAQVFLDDASGKKFEFRDTNKNNFSVEDKAAKFFVRVSDMDGTALFVKEGAVTWKNARSEKEVVVAAGKGILVNDDGQNSDLDPGTDWLGQINWEVQRPVAGQTAPAPEQAPEKPEQAAEQKETTE